MVLLTPVYAVLAPIGDSEDTPKLIPYTLLFFVALAIAVAWTAKSARHDPMP